MRHYHYINYCCWNYVVIVVGMTIYFMLLDIEKHMFRLTSDSNRTQIEKVICIISKTY